MKIAEAATTMAHKWTLPMAAVIHFKRPARNPLEQGEYHMYKLRTSPTNADSPVYELAVPFFESGSPE